MRTNHSESEKSDIGLMPFSTTAKVQTEADRSRHRTWAKMTSMSDTFVFSCSGYNSAHEEQGESLHKSTAAAGWTRCLFRFLLSESSGNLKKKSELNLKCLWWICYKSRSTAERRILRWPASCEQVLFGCKHPAWMNVGRFVLAWQLSAFETQDLLRWKGCKASLTGSSSRQHVTKFPAGPFDLSFPETRNNPLCTMCTLRAVLWGVKIRKCSKHGSASRRILPTEKQTIVGDGRTF